MTTNPPVTTVCRTSRRPKIAVACGVAVVVIGIAGSTRAASPTATAPKAVSKTTVPKATPSGKSVFDQYCVGCHTGTAAPAGMNLELLMKSSAGENFQKWQKVIDVLDSKKMPPEGMPQPSDAERAQATSWIHSELNTYIRAHAGDPGRVTVRRLTSGEYAYTIQDLTGLDNIDTGIDATSDSVGGEGFTNFGDVQFMQDANLEHYLQAAKVVADHAVVGSGPLMFYSDAGKTGFELSAISRVKDIYKTWGYRTVSGEGGKPYGLEKYNKALYAAWVYKNRVAMGQPAATIASLAAKEDVPVRFAQQVLNVMTMPGAGYPISDFQAHWRKLPVPTADRKASEDAARTAIAAMQKAITVWPSWFFARGDEAAGGAGDESPLVFNDKSLSAEAQHRFTFAAGGRGGRGAPPPTPGIGHLYLNTALLNPSDAGKAVIIWHNPTIGIRAAGAAGGRGAAAGGSGGRGAVVLAAGASGAVQVAAGASGGRGRGLPPGPRETLRSLVSRETADRLGFGKSPDGTPIGPDDFATTGSANIEIPLPQGVATFDFQADGELGKDRDQVFRIIIQEGENATVRGIPVHTFLGDMKSAGYKNFRAGVAQYLAHLPANPNFEPTPADKDPVPLPFDSTYNVPEHDKYLNDVKYVRDDKFVVDHILDDGTRRKLENAWNDVFASFSYHDNYLHVLAYKYKYELKDKHIQDMDKAAISALPEAMQPYVPALKAEYDAAMAAQSAARPGHVEDALKFATRAWRRPLTVKEKESLRAFYAKEMALEKDHTKAIKALLTRILVAPQFLYRVEQPAAAPVNAAAGIVRPVAALSPGGTARPLENYAMASRLSFFLWASIPDDELSRAAAAGELNNPQGLRRQVKRMLADPKARRLSTEFFGQWLGFYHFDQYKGVDTSRYTEFTQAVKEGMYDEAVSFFEYIIRQDRPVSEMLYADYTFVDPALAKYYGVKQEIKSIDDAVKVDNAHEFQRGGFLRMGAILTSTSAPLRTSPVKRGDWILRRVLGTPVPPPPPDAGSIPADDQKFGGLTLRQKMEAHKRNPTCANCHTRMEPLGFALEHYDSTGRWRETYAGNTPIEDSSALSDKTEIAGADGLLKYLKSKEPLVRRTLSYKLIGYALGRTVLASDQPLVDRMKAAGSDAKFSDLVSEIVASPQFRNQQAPDQSAKPTPASVAVGGSTKFNKAGVR